MLTLDELEHDPQVKARQMVIEVDDPKRGKIKQVGIGPKLSETPGSIRRLAPQLGEHTDEILGGLGLSKEDINRLREKGAVK
jgi:formyl-CoA transferase